MKIVLRGLKNKTHKRALARFCRKFCRALPKLRKNGELSFIFLSDRQIRRINRRFLKHDYATDVLSFAYEVPKQPKEPFPFGDIYISLDTARREAKKRNHRPLQELALYALHGTLHLLGYDDHTFPKRKKMFRAQTRIFRALAPTLVPSDFK